MGFFSRFRLAWKEAGKVSSSLDLWREIYGGRSARAGVTVNWHTALDVSTVLACCKVIAEGVAQVPLRLFQEKGDDKQPAVDHPLFPLLFRRPNRWQTSFEFRETIIFHTLLTGNAFVFVGKVGRNREIRELLPIEPGRVTVERDKETGVLRYKIRSETMNSEQIFPAEAIWHIRGPSWNTWLGLDAVKMARDAIGLSKAIENTQADFEKGGAKVSGLLSMSNTIGEDRFKFLAAWLDKHTEGGDRQGKPLILDNGADFKTMSMSGVDAQRLETRKHQVEEYARTVRVMPIMIGQADKAATYASAEQMFIAHVVHCLSPWYERLQQSAEVNLLTEDEWRREGYFIRFDPNALMRGAAKDQGDYFAKALGSGGGPAWMTQNEVRAKIDLPKHTSGDELFGPSALMAQPEEEPTENEPA
ncbi:phage portal protein [Taklimakanibacter deserti]|uniref:phage portal protein n=1 Tax=Taklimakanibacter deserti TaxID=2267839 RepID=UPI000E653475